MGKFTPSKNQKDIFNFILNDKRNAVISAVAGSGKTTTLLEALKLIPEDKTVLFLAFNVSIADELKLRAPQRSTIKVMTVHSFGFDVLRRVGDYKIDGYGKYRKIFRDIIDFYQGKNDNILDQYRFNKEHYRLIEMMSQSVKNEISNIQDFTKNVCTLCDIGRLDFIDFDTKPIGVSQLDILAEKHSINNENNESLVAWCLAKLGMDYLSEIDYTDMVFLPNKFNLDTDKYDYVFIDECQDLNTCQRLLMMRAIKPETGRFIAVGDPKQAIYAFAGADNESYVKLKSTPNTIELPLSVTYRCAEPIVKRVKHLNPFIKHHTKNKNGVVHDEFSYKDIQDGDMVLCRNTFPVVALCIKLLSEGRASYIIGSNIGASLKNMIEDCKRKKEEYNMKNVYSRLYSDKEKLIDKIMNNHKMTRKEAVEETQVILMSERISAIEAIAKDSDNPDEVVKKIEEIFSKGKKKGICLSNIHKSKGLEADRVFIIHPELMPSKYAKFPWQIEQERNLEYVAYTRAKTTLGFVTDFNAFKSHKSQEDNVEKLKESKHIGAPDMKMKLQLTVVDKRNVKGKFGDTVIYEMVDGEGNIFSKWGEINEDFLLSNDNEVKVNSIVSFYAIIKDHVEFRGNKITQLKKIMQY